VVRKLFSQLTMYQYKVLVNWTGLKPMAWDSQYHTQTTWPLERFFDLPSTTLDAWPNG
jgi:hypothetical protein